MQTYDILMIAVLAAATLFGFWKGLAWQIASLASLVVSYFVALNFADQLAPRISQHAPWNKFLAMLIIYAGTSFAIWMVFRIVAGAIDRVRLREFDRQMGALVGFGKGVLFCIAITFFAVTLLSEQQKQRIIASRSGQTIVTILDKAHSVVPPEIHQVIEPYLVKAQQRLDPNNPSPHSGQFENAQRLWELQQGASNWEPNNRPETNPGSTPGMPSPANNNWQQPTAQTTYQQSAPQPPQQPRYEQPPTQAWPISNSSGR